MNRRTLLSAAALLPIAACTVTSSGGTTTGTLDVAKIATDGGAIVTALQAALLAPPLVAVMGSDSALAAAALAGGQAALAEINTVTGGTVSASVDTSKVQALVSTLIADAQKALALAQAASAKLSGTVAETVGNYLAAAQVLLPFVAFAASLAVPVGARLGAPTMSEAQALAVARGAR